MNRNLYAQMRRALPARATKIERLEKLDKRTFNPDRSDTERSIERWFKGFLPLATLMVKRAGRRGRRQKEGSA